MSRIQRELSIAQRKRKRHVIPVRNNVNDLVGIPWKEERDLRKAIYDSLREQHRHPSPIGCRSKLTGSTPLPKLANDSKPKSRTGLPTRKTKLVKKAKRMEEAAQELSIEGEAGISRSPHPRKSRPLPGDLSHQFLFASSYSRSFALLSSRAVSRVARRTIARAVAAATTTVKKSISRRGRPLSSSTRPRRGRPSNSTKRLRNNSRISIRRDEDVKGNEDSVEVLVDGENGEIVPQMISKASNKASPTPSISTPARPSFPSLIKSTRSLPQQPVLLAASPEKWQDSRGQPVNVQDFVDFLCFYGTPCLDERLAWFMSAPGHRGSVNGTECPHGAIASGKGILRVFPACAFPKTPARPSVTPLQCHKAPVLPVARKTVSSWPIPLPELSIGLPSERLIETDSAPKEPVKPKRLTQSTNGSGISDISIANGSPSMKQGAPLKKAKKSKMAKKRLRNDLSRKSSPDQRPSSLPISNRSSLRSQILRSGLRSQALLRTRHQQRLVRR